MLYGNAVQNYYVDEVRKIYAERKARLAKIKTKKDAEKYVQDVRAKILKAFDLPSEKCPLDPIVTGEHKMPGMTIRNVVYYSRPEYPVTGLLFVPDKAKKAPGVLFLCGHAQNGKASGDYQTCAITLAKQGFVVLMIDPVNQGERYQFTEAQKKKYSIHCCNAHNFQGKQLHLCGEYFGAWRAWDAVRGIDYLQTLPEVDPDRIGVTGNSGGGTMTTFVNALEDRLIMAAASCYITTWQHEVENELPADIEQMPPDMLKYGLDMADFVIARAPRPTLIMGQKNDFFDPRGTMEAYEDAKAIYSLLGAEENVKVFIGPNSHGYHTANREQMYGFFCLHGQGKKKAVKEDPTLAPLQEKDTWATPGGIVKNLKVNKPLFAFINELADQRIAGRKKLSKKEMRKKLAELLQIGKIEVPYYRVLRPIYHAGERYIASDRYALETEPGTVMSMLKLHCQDALFHIPACEKAILYIPHLDAESETQSIKTKSDERLFALDVRGIGELMPTGCDQHYRDFFAQYNYDYHYASLGIMYRRPILGGKVRDILCALELLKERGVKNITLTAEGQGTVPALLAAVLSDIPVAVKLHHAPESWESMVRKEVTFWPISCMLPGILGITDLPELRKMVKNLTCTIAKEPALS